MNKSHFIKFIVSFLGLFLLLYHCNILDHSLAYANDTCEVELLSDITQEDLENLLKTVPKYMQYYNEDSTKDLIDIITFLNSQDMNMFNSTQIKYYYEITYNALAKLKYKTCDVPQIYVSTEEENGNTIKKDDGYVNASLSIVNCDGTTISDECGLIKVRGNSTAKLAKKSFNIKFSSKKNVFQMGKAKKWALIANCMDPTLIRNELAFCFAEYMGLDYVPERKWVELWIDGIYKGCYLFTEPIEVSSSRVNIKTESDFLIEYESKREEEDCLYLTSNGFRFILSEPEQPTEQRISEIQGLLDEITTAILTNEYEKYYQYIDMDSFVNYYILNELFKTVDFGYSSVYFYYKDNKLFAGPPWDYDLSTGNCNPEHSEGYYYKSLPTGIASNKQMFYNLCLSEEFMKEVKEK